MNQFIILIPILIAGIIIVAFFFGEKSILKRKLKKAEFKNIADFKDGETAKIVGRIEIVNEPLIAPLSKRLCALYHIRIEERVSNNNWETIIEEEETNTFLIKEGSHFAYINDEKPTKHIVKDKNYSSGFRKDASAQLERFLSNHRFKSENFLGFNKTLRYKEGVLEQDELVAVLGKGYWKEAKELGLPGAYGKILEIISDGEPIYLSDDPDTTLKTIKNKKVSKTPIKKRRHKERYRKRRKTE